MELPPGPRAPAAWQTVAWMLRPAAFLCRVHAGFGDPVTIRTYWTQEPMVLFSSPEAVRDVFRLDPEIAPAGQSWDFLREFAGPHSILLLDGAPHLRERRLLQAPFHGERMRALTPLVAALAREELGSWHGRVSALERMRALTLEVILRVVFGARSDQEVADLHAAVEGALGSVRSMPMMLAMALVQRDLGPRSPWGRFRIAVQRFDTVLLELVARRRAEASGRTQADRHAQAGGLTQADRHAQAGGLTQADRNAQAGGLTQADRNAQAGGNAQADGHARAGGDSVLALLLEQRDEDGNPPSDRHVRDQLIALLVGGHDSSAASLAWAFERLARHPAVLARIREGDPAYLDAVVKEVLRVRPALTIAPRRLLAPTQIAGRALPAGVQVAACLWLALRREDLWPQAGSFLPERWLHGPPAHPLSWIPFGGGLRRCAGAPFAEMEMREVLRAAADLEIRPLDPAPERARRSMLVVTPHRGAEILVRQRRPSIEARELRSCARPQGPRQN